MKYAITRWYFSDDWPSKIVKRGLTLEEAEAHCSNRETFSSTGQGTAAREHTRTHGPWFDSYDEE